MFGSEILDVVIGMIFIFLLLSLICSAINEIIEAWLNKRADFLENGIKELLNDPEGTGLVKELYNHPLINGLFRGNYGAVKTSMPSYIPARNFALALMDIIAPAKDEAKSGTNDATTSQSRTDSLQILRTAIDSNQLIDDKVKKALKALVDAAGDNAAKARENIEDWFNSSMDTVSGWYKKRAQLIILVLGFLIAAFTNADSITIANSLTYDKALRQSLVAAAGEYAKNETAPGTTFAAETPAPAPADFTQQCEVAQSNTGVCSQRCLNNTNLPECRLAANLDKIENLGLPIGWNTSNPRLVPQFALSANAVGAWLLKLLGWLITAFAITFGAPFWFDSLNKFMVVRAAVKPHEKSPEESSKD